MASSWTWFAIRIWRATPEARCLWPSDSVPGTAQGLPRAVERSFKSQGLSLSLSLHQRPINNLLAKVNDLWGVSWLQDWASPAGIHQKPSHCRLGWLLSGLSNEAFPGLVSRGQSSVALIWVFPLEDFGFDLRAPSVWNASLVIVVLCLLSYIWGTWFGGCCLCTRESCAAAVWLWDIWAS